MSPLQANALATADDYAQLQRQMKADLKSSLGKKNVKFVAAKKVEIGTVNTGQLFIVTANPAAFETVLKSKHPGAYRATGLCNVVKSKSGKVSVVIKKVTGQMTPASVALVVTEAVGKDPSIKGSVAEAKTKLGDKVKLKPTGSKNITKQLEKQGVNRQDRLRYRYESQRRP
jgi:hypothetical protein